MSIGGAFPLKKGNFTLPFKSGGCLLTTNARSALYILHKLLKPKTTWLPSYCCRSIVHPEYNVKFYAVNKNLNIQPFQADRDDLVLVINYFGFPHQEIDTKAVVVEDAAQAYFTPTRADYAIFSPTKCLGTPDGGILWSKKPIHWPLEDAPKEWLQWAERGRQPNGFEATQKAKSLSPTGPYRMHFQDCLYHDPAWADQYIRNYVYLQERLPSFMGVARGIPTGFPILVERRDELLQKLYAERIYPPVHWRIEGVVPQKFADSHWLSQHIMTLPCDYRYNETDMQRMVDRLCSEPILRLTTSS